MSLKDVLTIRTEIAVSSLWNQKAAMAFYKAAIKLWKNSKTQPTVMPILEGWSKTGGEFPIYIGSFWPCDAPYLLNKIALQPNSEKELQYIIECLLNMHGENEADKYEKPAYYEKSIS